MIELILGGARSGKSRFAEARAQESGKKKVYFATAQALDKEMTLRIAQHQKQRGKDWALVEEPTHLANALLHWSSPEYFIVIDCLTLWLSNCLHNNCLDEQKKSLIQLLPQLSCDVCMVSNEVGSGVIPLGQLSRDFVDQSGWLHQHIATISERVTLVVAGLPLSLKPVKS